MAQAGQHREYLSRGGEPALFQRIPPDSRDARGCGPALLQQALEQTLPHFAAFNVRLRHCLFWNYLETNRATPQVLPEQDAPCRYIDPVETGRFLFRVLYYGSRVHLRPSTCSRTARARCSF